jgi:chemotaxis receptor (MCP) glutamine deamidase CheD
MQGDVHVSGSVLDGRCVRLEMLDLNDRKAGGLSHVMLVEPIQVTSVDLVGTSEV